MHIKMTLRFHLTPIRIAKIKNENDSKFCRGCGERETLLHCWWDCKLVKTTLETVNFLVMASYWLFLIKLQCFSTLAPSSMLDRNSHMNLLKATSQAICWTALIFPLPDQYNHHLQTLLSKEFHDRDFVYINPHQM
jgi:hypothetical protein